MVIALLLAAGNSKRMNGIDKINVLVTGRPLWKYSYETLKNHPKIQKVFVVGKDIKGGKTRFQSAKKGFFEVLKKEKLLNSDIVLFHNAANPLLTSQELNFVIQKAKRHGACIAGHRATDTIKLIKKNKIRKTLPRKNILLAQTPQAFKVGLLKKSYAQLKIQKSDFNDESSLIESMGIKPEWISASPLNKKITTREDLTGIISLLGQPESTGIATDSHEFDTGGTLKLGGIFIKNFPKLKANSDGDIILHAIATALSQGLAGGSLGTFANPLFSKGITKSAEYLKPLIKKLHQKNLKIQHIGIHLETQKPRIDRLAEKIKKSLAKILKIPTENIGLTATSGEGTMHFGKGIYCLATVTLSK